MKIYGSATGEIIRFLQTEEDERRYPDPPEGAVFTLEIDGETNPGIVQSLNTDWSAHRLISDVLYRNGELVTIQPDSAATVERKAALSLARGLKEYNGRSNPTTAQTVAAVKANNRLTLILARLLLHEMEGE